MKIDADITILIGHRSTTITIRDRKASTEFVEVTLTPEQLSMALSRLSYTPCECEIRGLDKIGKIHENRKFEFEIDPRLRYEREQEELFFRCKTALRDAGMDDWEPDTYFASQDSFFTQEGKQFARAIIRRWI